MMLKHWKYLKYLVRHKWFVFVAGLQVGAPLWRLVIHDWSKFLPCEWFPYVEMFYGQPKVGDIVQVDCCDGFSGLAEITGTRQSEAAKYRVEMLPNELGGGQEFWAHDFEIGALAKTQKAFDAAWLHHQHANPHHWQHWVLREDSGNVILLEMPESLVREMVADWMGAGRAITGKWEVAEWYTKNRDVIQLAAKTRLLVEQLVTSD